MSTSEYKSPYSGLEVDLAVSRGLKLPDNIDELLESLVSNDDVSALLSALNKNIKSLEDRMAVLEAGWPTLRIVSDDKAVPTPDKGAITIYAKNNDNGVSIYYKNDENKVGNIYPSDLMSETEGSAVKLVLK